MRFAPTLNAIVTSLVAQTNRGPGHPGPPPLADEKRPNACES